MAEGEIFDQQKLAMIVAAANDALRPIGLTLIHDGVNAVWQQGQTMINFPCLVREEGVTRLSEDKASREEFQKMMARNHEEKLKEEADRIRKAAADPGSLEDVLFGDGSADDGACAHENRHPEGFCLDCSEGLT